MKKMIGLVKIIKGKYKGQTGLVVNVIDFLDELKKEFNFKKQYEIKLDDQSIIRAYAKDCEKI